MAMLEVRLQFHFETVLPLKDMPVCNLEPVEKAHAVVNLALSDCLSPSEVCAFRLTKVSAVMEKIFVLNVPQLLSC